ncbi:MAG: ABC transporter C-terminal domain-containing protein, partial [Treponema sp.]|nr:ABC transporter C-terminal domain-containing protein [Treponema sp.]
ERREAELLAAIEKLEKEKSSLELELANPQVYSDGIKAKFVKQKLDECEAALIDKNNEWEILALQSSEHSKSQ